MCAIDDQLLLVSRGHCPGRESGTQAAMGDSAVRTSNRSGVGSSGRAPRNQPATWIETAVAPVGAEASMEMAPKVPGCHLVVRGHRVVGCPCLPSRGRLVVEGLPHGGVLDG